MADFALSKTLIQHFVLNERSILHLLKKETGLNRTDLEVLIYSANNLTFTVYQVQSYYRHTQLQTIRRAIIKLSLLKLFEAVGIGKVARAKVYMLTPWGRQYLNTYYQLWESNV